MVVVWKRFYRFPGSWEPSPWHGVCMWRLGSPGFLGATRRSGGFQECFIEPTFFCLTPGKITVVFFLFPRSEPGMKHDDTNQSECSSASQLEPIWSAHENTGRWGQLAARALGSTQFTNTLSPAPATEDVLPVILRRCL